MTVEPAFPVLHVRPPTGWVNDPNGPFRWNGTYHLFYQHNPSAPVHAQIAWGHSSSTDLLRWRTEPVALTPTPGHLDAGGCWSGCVVDDAGVPTAVYTGIGDGVLDASVCLATADDDTLRSWSKQPAAAARPPEGLDLLGYRDPFVFTVDGRRYALVGAGLAGGGAATVLLYACDDLRAWTYLGPLLDTGDAVAKAHAPADIWECPQLVRLADRWVLIVSLWTDEVLGQVAYLAGDLDVSGGVPRFTPTHGGLVDSGRDFYAPAVLPAPDRTLMWGWTWEDRGETDVLASGWAGALTLPRELSLDAAGRLVTAPARELHALRGAATTRVLGAQESLLLPSGPLDIEIRLHCPPDRPATLALGSGDELTVTVDPATGQVDLRRRVHHADRAARAAAGRVTPHTNVVDVRLLLDGSIVELFLPDGVVFTERLYPASTSHDTVLHVRGAPGTQAEVTAWQLRTPGAQ
ncbi:glycoside hydrolase family 32 protein [Phytohabitans aurantiacus]|uniref:beta-fructofuranosidase n=1 Tax=Phytohabitans aurantiacus TaxID=3016789 RepID=A0ABQ5QQ11_9ACTN|nr:glycoside hydrolase family 32 protein [Phytohabitans aurantiacus]GLH96317.1 glycosyl hydrolase family 32 [Phytohabitans aurantiacus]